MHQIAIGSTATPSDGLNRIVTVAGAGVGYDGRGNLTYDPTSGRSFGYWSENEMVAASGGYGYGHDAFARTIDTVVGGAVTRQFVYDANEVVATYQPGVGLVERYVRGDAPDELIAWYDGAGATTRRWAHADERGSVIAVSDDGGNVTAINRYDEYGKPAATNLGRFQYTGQMYLSEIGVYNYKNRAYAPHLGRFLQTDPIGTDGGINLYAYVGNDPVNFTDPLGLCSSPDPYTDSTGAGVVTGRCPGAAQELTGSLWLGANNRAGPGARNNDGGGGGIGGSDKPQSQQSQPRCGNGWAAWIADKADKVSLVSGGIATTSGLLGLATAPTGAGFAGFESVAAVSGLISYGAAGVGAIAHFANGDAVGGILDLGGAAGGYAIGKLAGRALASTRTFGDLSASQTRQAALAGNGAGTAAGAAASLYSCR